MKKLLFIPALSLLCFSCSCSKNDSGDCGNNNCNNRTQSNCSNGAMESSENTGDWQITTKVKSAIMSDSSISGSARFVSVNTTNGVVTLTGKVPTQDDSDRIVSIAKNVRGVMGVNNQMTVTNN